MNSHQKKLILFVKAPVPGLVKTRLVPPLTHAEASELYKTWAKEIFQSVSHLLSVSVEIAYDAHPPFPTPQWLNNGQDPIPFFLQNGKDLGEKLCNAFQHAFQNGCGAAAALGSDSPGLPLEYLAETFNALKSCDLVLGPTQDGGYYLIGFKERSFPELFREIAWSSRHVLDQTLEKAKALNLRVHLLPPYFDVDVAEDLKRLTNLELKTLSLYART